MTKKEVIKKAALELLAEQGVHATPMSAIAKKAGTGMGTIYNYFPNKENLINHLYVCIKNEERTIFKGYNSEQSLKKQFENYYKNTVDFFIDNRSYFHFIEQLQASPIITQESKRVGYNAIASVLELIENGKREKQIKRIDTEELMNFIGGTILSFLRLHHQDDTRVMPSLKNHLDMVWDAIKN